MSLDDMLAVARAAHGYPGMLIFGLALSIALVALAANLVAFVLERHRWLAYLGVAVVAYVALDMIWRGMNEVMEAAAVQYAVQVRRHPRCRRRGRETGLTVPP
jgi:predicted tellurium resistance membrane protein TerC